MRRTSPEVEAEIMELREAGLSYTQIAARVGVIKSTVAAVVRRYGQPAPARPATTERDAEILRRRDAGQTYARIAADMSLSLGTVHTTLKRAGRATRTRPRWTPEVDALLIDRFAAGDSQEQIAAVVGFSSSAVSVRIQHLGLTRERPRPVRHGRPVCWQTGCQDPVCVEARRIDAHEQYLRGLERGPRTHGLSGFTRGCRCDVCRRAHQEQMTARQERTRETAIAHGEPWSADEDEAIQIPGLRIEDLARDLGRTYSAVDNRRRYLSRRGQK